MTIMDYNYAGRNFRNRNHYIAMQWADYTPFHDGWDVYYQKTAQCLIHHYYVVIRTFPDSKC